MRIYTDLADRWHELSEPEDYAEEAAIFVRALEAAAAPATIERVLELGCGGGNNASHLKAHFALTLVDVSAPMLEQSRRLNPECTHHEGDMRTVRLDATFDAVFVHDAVMYLTTEADLAAAMTTAFEHLEPGGVALFVPDETAETFRAGHDCGGSGSIRYLEWSHDPDPTDTTFDVDYALLVHDAAPNGAGTTRVVHDSHRLGLFPRATWLRLLEATGFDVRTLPYEHSEFAPDAGFEMFLGVRPGPGDSATV